MVEGKAGVQDWKIPALNGVRFERCTLNMRKMNDLCVSVLMRCEVSQKSSLEDKINSARSSMQCFSDPSTPTRLLLQSVSSYFPGLGPD